MIIAARNKFEVTRSTQSLLIEIYIYDINDVKPASPTYTINKKSFAAVDEDLTVNIATFIRDYFELDNTNKLLRSILNVDLTVNTVDESHTAYYGYKDYDYNLMGNTDISQAKNIPINTAGQIPINDLGITNVIYMADNGNTLTVPYSASSEGLQYIDIVGVDLTGAKRYNILIDGSNPITYYYNIECDGTDISFVNSKGVWEDLNLTGRRYDITNSKSKDYISYKTFEKTTYNTNGNKLLKLNTGFCGEFINDTIEQLLLSDNIVLLSTGEKLIITTKNIEKKSSRYDKMIDYTLDFEFAKNVIQW